MRLSSRHSRTSLRNCSRSDIGLLHAYFFFDTASIGLARNLDRGSLCRLRHPEMPGLSPDVFRVEAAKGHSVNWKLVLQLSMFGLGMGIATVFVIPSNFEPLFWLAIFIVCAAIISKKCRKWYFLNGVMVSLLNSVWVTSAHVLLFNIYKARHASEMAMMSGLPMGDSPRLMMIILLPVVGIISGLVLGLFSYAAHLLRTAF